jgi:hypothetical protein
MSSPTECDWEGAADTWKRLGDANREATVAWLQTLTLEEPVRLTEELCEGIPGLRDADVSDDPPVVLARIRKAAPQVS